MERQERRLAAILAADVAGYSRLMAADEAGTLARFNALRSELIDPKIAQFKGRVVGTAGDSLLVEFAGAVDAVQCAVEVQERLAARNAEFPEDRRMAFRMGVNLGDVIAEGDTIHGDGVNVASRLERLAEPGAVVVGRGIHDQVRGKLPYAFNDLGEHSVKNIAEPVRAFLVTPAERSAPSPVKADDVPPPSAMPSIAVLPFTNMSGDPEQEYFSDGITEDIITELSRFRDLIVIARNSSFAFKGQSVNVREIGRALDVRYVVEGSVRKAGGRVRVTVQLIETAADRHLWAERYDRPLDDIFAVQDEIVEAVVRQVTRSLDDEALDRARRAPPANLSAYDRLLRARRDWVRSDFPGALANLNAAIALDPNLAQAYAVKAFLLAFELWMSNPDFANTEMVALDCARKALSLDERDAYVQALVGWFHLFRGSFDEALRCTEKAVALNPNDVVAMTFRGGTLAFCGRASEGLSWFERAFRIDPFGWSERWAEVYVESLFTARDYTGCLAAFDRLQNPAFYEYMTAAASYAYLDRMEEAHAAVREYKARKPSYFTNEMMAEGALRMLRLADSRNHWIEGFRKAGLEV